MSSIIGSGITGPFSQGVVGPAHSQMGQAQAGAQMASAAQRFDPHSTHVLVGMINSRLRNGSPFEVITAHYLGNERFVVFVVHKGQYTTIEDGELFPSDNLITKLRLLAD